MGIDDTDLDALEADAVRVLAIESNVDRRKEIDTQAIVERLTAAVSSLRLEVSNQRVRELRDEETISELRRKLQWVEGDAKSLRDDLRDQEKEHRRELRAAVAQARLDAIAEQDGTF